VVPIPGTSSLNRLVENAAASEIELSEAELDRIEQLSPTSAVAGTRYSREMMGLVNR
jgi:diketogulonate reductase-like aldo/keto reductase